MNGVVQGLLPLVDVLARKVVHEVYSDIAYARFGGVYDGLFSLVSAVGAGAGGGGVETIPFLFLWLIPAFLLLIAIVVAIIYTVKGRREIAAGIWAGIGIGIVSMGLTCFANMQALW